MRRMARTAEHHAQVENAETRVHDSDRPDISITARISTTASFVC